MSCATPILPSGPLGHVPEMTGHVAEIVGHDPETAGHVHPKYALCDPTLTPPPLCPPASSKKALPKSSTLNASLDGVSINFLNEFHFESPVFSFAAPSPVSNFIFNTPGVTSSSISPISVSDGYWIAIKPLPVGQHTLTFSAPGINMLYRLNVQ
jgi:hypothetical protein